MNVVDWILDLPRNWKKEGQGCNLRNYKMLVPFPQVLICFTVTTPTTSPSSTLWPFPNTAEFSNYTGMQRDAQPHCVIHDEKAAPEDIKYKL